MTIYCKHFFYGYPLGAPKDNELIIRDIYALSNNNITRFADWVAYRSTITDVMGENDQTRMWRTDPWLTKTQTLEAEPNDAYKDAFKTLQYERGHQAPLASFRGSMYWYQSNYYSNITPQKADLNEGPWVQLENMERNIVKTNKTVYAMTGPLYEREMPGLPNAKVTHKVPSGYWKIIIVPRSYKIDANFDAVAFIFDQATKKEEKVLDHLTTIREIENRTCFNFLWLLDKSIQDKVETANNRAFAEAWFKE
ncbi:MAG: DNA/RNA non-specific endonuclease [Candidatus Omnitrophota bacterium]